MPIIEASRRAMTSSSLAKSGHPLRRPGAAGGAMDFFRRWAMRNPNSGGASGERMIALRSVCHPGRRSVSEGDPGPSARPVEDTACSPTKLRRLRRVSPGSRLALGLRPRLAGMTGERTGPRARGPEPRGDEKEPRERGRGNAAIHFFWAAFRRPRAADRSAEGATTSESELRSQPAHGGPSSRGHRVCRAQTWSAAAAERASARAVARSAQPRSPAPG